MAAKPAVHERHDPTDSFILQFELAGAMHGPLVGTTAAIKDLFDVKGYPTGFGNPTWLATHPDPAPDHAPPVKALLEAGAMIVGKTHMDELAYSLNGENAHYGTPTNVAAPGRIPGGSSSGSAAAVAAGQADIGLGSDTGGSVRVPASYCGLWGVRPTHGRISLAAAAPLAPSFDTVGWFTRSAALLRTAGGVMFDRSNATPPPAAGPRWLVAKDAFALAMPEAERAIYDCLAGDAFDRVTAVLGKPSEVEIGSGVAGAPELEGLKSWMGVFRVTQGWEVWKCHGKWLTENNPDLGPGIKDRFQWASTITQDQWQAADAQRSEIRAHMVALLGRDGVLAMPTAPGPAIPRDMPAAQVDDWRTRLLSLTCVAGLAGLPQVNIPLARVDGLPVGLSLVGPPGSDEWLMELAEALAAAANRPATPAGAASA